MGYKRRNIASMVVGEDCGNFFTYRVYPLGELLRVDRLPALVPGTEDPDNPREIVRQLGATPRQIWVLFGLLRTRHDDGADSFDRHDLWSRNARLRLDSLGRCHRVWQCQGEI